MAGAVPPTSLCTDLDWVLTDSGPTFAEYTGSQGFVSLTVDVTYDCTATGSVDLWIESVTITLATDNTPTAPYTITGPDSGFHTFSPTSGSGNVTGIRLEWDVPGAFATLCATAVNNT
jgi:hypothetical protein